MNHNQQRECLLNAKDERWKPNFCFLKKIVFLHYTESFQKYVNYLLKQTLLTVWELSTAPSRWKQYPYRDVHLSAYVLTIAVTLSLGHLPSVYVWLAGREITRHRCEEWRILFGCLSSYLDVRMWRMRRGSGGQMLWFVSQSLSDSDSNPMMDGVRGQE